MQPQQPDYKRISLAIFLSAVLLISWQALVEWPRRQHLAQHIEAQTQIQDIIKKKEVAAVVAKEADTEYNPTLSRAQRLALSKRVEIKSEKLHGSFALTGARFDDLTLSKYKVSLDKDSPDVTLFSPNGDDAAYFAQAGWVATDGATKVPDQHSLWKADKTTLAPQSPVTLSWDNGAGVTFIMKVALDSDYMFTITQRVENHSGHEITVTPYGYLNRVYVEGKKQYALLHEGPLGVLDGTLSEINYKDLREKGAKAVDNATGWLGITDKYWLAAMVPVASSYKADFSYDKKHDQDRYQVDYLGQPEVIAGAGSDASTLRLFAGAKEMSVLDRYTTGDAASGLPPIPLFNYSVDFGRLYFLTIPMFHMLNFFYLLIGNFGLAIMLMTIVVKLAMFPLANKSYKSMSQMRALQPHMTTLREKHAGDSTMLNKEMIALYKKHQVNPASGCLPLIIQMPVFFALYKVLFVTLEMRQAPFFGWLRDLSAPDPSNIFTGFGLIDVTLPSWLHLGLLPILMCVTMVLQQRQQPAPTDPVQAKMMKVMPYMFLFFFASFPAGLVLYWVWSNTLSIVQSAFITKRHGKLPAVAPAAKKAKA